MKRYRRNSYKDVSSSMFAYGENGLEDNPSVEFELIELVSGGDNRLGYIMNKQIRTGEIYSIDAWDLNNQELVNFLNQIGFKVGKIHAYYLRDRIFIADAETGEPVCMLSATDKEIV